MREETICTDEGLEFTSREEMSELQFQTVWEQINGSLVPISQYVPGTLEHILENRLKDLLYFQSLDLDDFVSAVLEDLEEEGIWLVNGS